MAPDRIGQENHTVEVNGTSSFYQRLGASTMASGTATSLALDELVKIDGFLERPHLLIGGLAVRKYVVTRESADIDLVCDATVAKKLVAEVYPDNLYDHTDSNDNELRPAYVMKHKVNRNEIVLFGPKLLQREAYFAIDWEMLSEGAIPFSYSKREFPRLLVPSLEALAFMKLISFIARVRGNLKKGEQDLRDFVSCRVPHDCAVI